jgi:Resolvase, N terminal domain
LYANGGKQRERTRQHSRGCSAHNGHPVGSQPVNRSVSAAFQNRNLAGFRSLKDTWADTTTPHGQLMLTILGGLAEFERALIRARTGEGRERAKARGVRFGRPKKFTPHQRREAMDGNRRRRSRRRGGAHVRARPSYDVSAEAVANASGRVNRPHRERAGDSQAPAPTGGSVLTG